jgi:hypothetical protein
MSFSLLLRRCHLYLALFLFPWMLMYALSTLVMNHRAIFVRTYGQGPIPYDIEREVPYEATFPSGAGVRDISRQILASLDLDGAHGVTKRPEGTIVITRNDLLVPRRITYLPAERRVRIERMQARANALLERFHRRRGYATGYLLDTLWAVAVDLVLAAMLFWALSGLWMWWEMKVTRRLGAAALTLGLAVFAFYLSIL